MEKIIPYIFLIPLALVILAVAIALLWLIFQYALAGTDRLRQIFDFKRRRLKKKRGKAHQLEQKYPHGIYLYCRSALGTSFYDLDESQLNNLLSVDDDTLRKYEEEAVKHAEEEQKKRNRIVELRDKYPHAFDVFFGSRYKKDSLFIGKEKEVDHYSAVEEAVWRDKESEIMESLRPRITAQQWVSMYPLACSSILNAGRFSVNDILYRFPERINELLSHSEQELQSLQSELEPGQQIQVRDINDDMEKEFLYQISHEKKDNYQEFEDFLKENNIKYFYHFTDRQNIESIKQFGGLFSWKYAEEHGIIIPHAGGESLSRELDIRYGLEDYVHLSFTPDHPMKYRLKDEEHRRLVLLRIKAEVALLKYTMFSDKNSTDAEHIHGDSIDNIRAVSLYATRDQFIDGNHLIVDRASPEYNKLKQAEVLVKTFVPVEYIVNIDKPRPI